MLLPNISSLFKSLKYYFSSTSGKSLFKQTNTDRAYEQYYLRSNMFPSLGMLGKFSLDSGFRYALFELPFKILKFKISIWKPISKSTT